MAWTKVCLPKELGGLGISDLQNLGWALQLRWLWLMKTDPTHPWTNFHVPVHKCFQAFFSITVVSEIGYGAATLFWTDRWICSQSIADLAPQVLALISKRKRNKGTVLEALADLTWVRDILGTLSVLLIFSHSISPFGFSSHKSYYNQSHRWKTLMFGGSMVMGIIHQNLPL